MTFVNDPPNYRTVDRERDAVLQMLFSRGREINLFVLEWGGRRIPFWGEKRVGRDPASGTETLRWEVVRIGIGHDDGLPERTVPTYRFASAEEREAATALILEGLRVHESSPRSPNPLIVDVVLGREERRRG
jgi:hypothetical protein